MHKSLLVAGVAIVLAACGGGGGGAPVAAPTPTPTPTPPPAPPPPAPEPDPPPPVPSAPKPFVDVTAPSMIDYVAGFTLPGNAVLGQAAEMVEVTFGGAAAGDCDNDGDIDLFVTSGDNGPNNLYINQLIGGSGAPLQFADQAEQAGVANTRSTGENDRHSGPVFADMDGDGFLDLFLGALFFDPVKVYRNTADGTCTFEDVTEGSGLESLLTQHTITGSFGDYDLDGDLDLMLAHWGSDRASDELPTGETEHLFRNVSNSSDGIRFENVSVSTDVSDILIETQALGILDVETVDFVFTPLFARINEDLWPDLAVASDFGTASLLISDIGSSGTFLNRTNDAVREIQYGMGAALGDIDSDGDLDWFVTSIFGEGLKHGQPLTGNRLLLNPGGDFSSEQFGNITSEAGVADGRWGWSACFLDVDNDADLDLFHTNGWLPPFTVDDDFSHDRSRLFLADSTDPTDPTEITFTESAEDFGLDDDFDTRGGVCADFDNDGDVDIFLVTKEQDNSGRLWENESAASGNNSLRVRLIGLPPNTEASGARIFATSGGRTQMREVIIGNNYLSQNPAIQIFGLGTSSAVSSLRVEWPPLDIGGTGNPDQPTEWVKTAVPATGPGETVVICHPEIAPLPECVAPD